jgi:hypothetical protein
MKFKRNISKHKHKYRYSFVFTLLSSLISTQTLSMEINQCNKMWGVTQDANGAMLYKVEMYMCIEDPYNIYKTTYLKSSTNPLSSAVLPINFNLSNDTNKTNKTSNSVFNLTNSTYILTDNNNNTQNNNNNLENNSLRTSTTTISPFSKNKTKIDTEINTSNPINNTYANITNHTNNLEENNSSPLNLRAQRSMESSSNISTTNNDLAQTIIIIISIIFGHMILVALVYYKKRRCKVQQDNSKSNTKTKSNTISQHKRKPTLKPFIKELPYDPNLTASYLKNLQSPPPLPPKHPPHINQPPIQPPYTTRSNNLSINTTEKHKRQLNINHEALTPNTKQIYEESSRSLKKWRKKTFPQELRQSSKDEHRVIPDKNGNVKLMVEKKEKEIQKKNSRHPSFFAH